MKILTIIGARPQFIKAAVLSQKFATAPDLDEVVVHTGQHFDANMSDFFFNELGMEPPSYNLGISGGGHGSMTGQMLSDLEPIIQAEAPDWVLVYGDTNSTLAGALAASKLHVRVAHVEAGLRSFNRRMPEETNRVVADHLSDLLFAPTATAVTNLKNEGRPEEAIHLVGDIMYDAALFFGEKARDKSSILENLGLKDGEYILATIHRAENTDAPQRLSAILEALANASSSLPVTLPLHPRTRQILNNGTSSRALTTSNIRLIEPVGYLDMVRLEQSAALIATDSGGVQKEAFFHGVPCVTLRDETEWVELIELGWNRLAPPTTASSVQAALTAAMASLPRKATSKPYGEGNAADLMMKIMGNTK